MTDPKKLRKQLFVDPKVQGTLVGRVVLYWFVCLITITLMLLCWRVLTGPTRLFHSHLNEMWFQFGPAVVASLLLLPMILVDIVRMSNRFVGPLIRLRRGLHALAQGEQVKPLRFRDDDFWQEFADEYNAVLERIAKLEPAANASPESSTTDDADDATPGPPAETPQESVEVAYSYHQLVIPAGSSELD